MLFSCWRPSAALYSAPLPSLGHTLQPAFCVHIVDVACLLRHKLACHIHATSRVLHELQSKQSAGVYCPLVSSTVNDCLIPVGVSLLTVSSHELFMWSCLIVAACSGGQPASQLNCLTPKRRLFHLQSGAAAMTTILTMYVSAHCRNGRHRCSTLPCLAFSSVAAETSAVGMVARLD